MEGVQVRQLEHTVDSSGGEKSNKAERRPIRSHYCHRHYVSKAFSINTAQNGSA